MKNLQSYDEIEKSRKEMKNLQSYDEFINEKDDFFSSRIEAQQLRKDMESKFGSKLFHSMYDKMNTNLLLKTIGKSKWVLKDDAEEEWDSSISSITGVTDYKNHTKDSLETLKDLVIQSIKKNIPEQTLNFYNIEGKLFDMVIVRGEPGGWTAKVYWTDKQPGFKTIARQIR